MEFNSIRGEGIDMRRLFAMDEEGERRRREGSEEIRIRFKIMVFVDFLFSRLIAAVAAWCHRTDSDADDAYLFFSPSSQTKGYGLFFFFCSITTSLHIYVCVCVS